MEVLRQYQADIMMILGGIMAIFVFLTNTMSKKRKFALMLLEISAVFLLISDRAPTSSGAIPAISAGSWCGSAIFWCFS